MKNVDIKPSCLQKDDIAIFYYTKINNNNSNIVWRCKNDYPTNVTGDIKNCFLEIRTTKINEKTHI